MKLKGAFTDKSGIFQLWVLLCLVVGGMILSSILLLLLGIGNTPDSSLNQPGTLRFVQALSVVFSFLLPSLAMAWLCSPSYMAYLSLDRTPSFKLLFLVLIGLLLFNPTISLTNTINQQMELPSFMGSLEEWMRDKEKEMEDLVNLLLNDNGVGAFISNLLVIALLAAITEEMLFRGVGQRIIERWTNNPHLVIWGAAFVFSAIHLQFYGFIPRMLLGAYFGYLLYWTKSLWVPIFAHFVNNASAVIASKNEHLNENEFISGEISSEHMLGFSVVAALSLVLFWLLNKKIKEVAAKRG